MRFALWAAVAEDELVAFGVGFAEAPFVREGAAVLFGSGFSMFRDSWSGAGRPAVRGIDLFAPAIACCHTAPIGNLGMRTQATRHFECTGNLHGVLRAAFVDADGDARS